MFYKIMPLSNNMVDNKRWKTYIALTLTNKIMNNADYSNKSEKKTWALYSVNQCGDVRWWRMVVTHGADAWWWRIVVTYGGNVWWWRKVVT